ncbi:MAG: DUF1848 family protein [Candidatus Lokiarchaeota archaeon]|nr:DUF1848 family protein [Candidatus Lokiarchaeota archaeon]
MQKWDIFSKYIPSTHSPNKVIPIYLQFTCNSIVKVLDPLTPSLEKYFFQFDEITGRVSPDHIMWRFDLIIFWKEDGVFLSNHDYLTILLMESY